MKYCLYILLLLLLACKQGLDLPGHEEVFISHTPAAECLLTSDDLTIEVAVLFHSLIFDTYAAGLYTHRNQFNFIVDLDVTEYILCFYWQTPVVTMQWPCVVWDPPPVVDRVYRLAVVYDAEGADQAAVSFFVDGAQVGDTQLCLEKGCGVRFHEGTTPIYLGSRGAEHDFYLNGTIGGLRHWDTARTSIEISAYSFQAVDPSSAHLQGYWRLNRSLKDATSHGNDFMFSGTTVYVPLLSAGEF